jgi:AcrR family transcriptional regulator
MASTQRGIHARERLLTAAIDVFAARGFRAGTVREITMRAGLNVAAVNYHFANKEALYQASLDRALAHASVGMDWVRPGLSTEALLRSIVTDLVEGSMGGRTPPHIRLLAAELQQPTGALRAVLRSAGVENHNEQDVIRAHWILGSCLAVIQVAPDTAYGSSVVARQYRADLIGLLVTLISEGISGRAA